MCTINNTTKVCCQPLCLLLHRCGARFVSIATSDLVKMVCSKFPSGWWNISVFFAYKRFPFDWQNPIGYLIAMFFEYIILGYQIFIDGCILALAMSACWFIISATKEIQRILHSIKHTTHTNELIVLFAEFVDTHGVSKQLRIFQSLSKDRILYYSIWFNFGIWNFNDRTKPQKSSIIWMNHLS